MVFVGLFSRKLSVFGRTKKVVFSIICWFALSSGSSGKCPRCFRMLIRYPSSLSLSIDGFGWTTSRCFFVFSLKPSFGVTKIGQVLRFKGNAEGSDYVRTNVLRKQFRLEKLEPGSDDFWCTFEVMMIITLDRGYRLVPEEL